MGPRGLEVCSSTHDVKTAWRSKFRTKITLSFNSIFPWALWSPLVFIVLFRCPGSSFTFVIVNSKQLTLTTVGMPRWVHASDSVWKPLKSAWGHSRESRASRVCDPHSLSPQVRLPGCSPGTVLSGRLWHRWALRWRVFLCSALANSGKCCCPGRNCFPCVRFNQNSSWDAWFCL